MSAEITYYLKWMQPLLVINNNFKEVIKINITQSDFTNLKRWIYHNARPLDIARWKFHFEKGTVEDVLEALQTYQNEDGGFGNALEADSWNPNSTPYTTSIAVRFLNEINFIDKSHPMIKGMLNYLENTTAFSEGYWPAIIPTNNEYPHAPWWSFQDKAGLEEWGYTPTIELVGFILTFAEENSTLYKRASEIAKNAIDKYLNGVTSKGSAYKATCREGEIGCFRYLVHCLEDTNKASQYQTQELKNALQGQVKKFIERDTAKWTQYCYKPSQFINSPDNIFYAGNEEIMDTELDYILNKRNKEGVWDIVWNWGAYHNEYEISKNWWKSNIIINNLLLMRNFGKFDLSKMN